MAFTNPQWGHGSHGSSTTAAGLCKVRASFIGGQRSKKRVPARTAFFTRIPVKRVFFSLKPPFLGGGLSVTVLASNVAQVTVVDSWNGSYGSMRPGGHIRLLHLVMLPSSGGNDRCSMFPFLRGVERHVLALQSHTSGCIFWFDWFVWVWINGTQGTCHSSSFGDGVHARCSMGPQW